MTSCIVLLILCLIKIVFIIIYEEVIRIIINDRRLWLYLLSLYRLRTTWFHRLCYRRNGIKSSQWRWSNILLLYLIQVLLNFLWLSWCQGFRDHFIQSEIISILVMPWIQLFGLNIFLSLCRSFDMALEHLDFLLNNLFRLIIKLVNLILLSLLWRSLNWFLVFGVKVLTFNHKIIPNFTLRYFVPISLVSSAT